MRSVAGDALAIGRVGSSVKTKRWFAEVGLLLPLAIAVGLVPEGATVVAVRPKARLARVFALFLPSSFLPAKTVTTVSVYSIRSCMLLF